MVILSVKDRKTCFIFENFGSLLIHYYYKTFSNNLESLLIVGCFFFCNINVSLPKQHRQQQTLTSPQIAAPLDFLSLEILLRACTLKMSENCLFCYSARLTHVFWLIERTVTWCNNKSTWSSKNEHGPELLVKHTASTLLVKQSNLERRHARTRTRTKYAHTHTQLRKLNPPANQHKVSIHSLVPV